MSSISPDLHGDIKAGHGAFLMPPVSRQDLAESRFSRNFWVRTGDGKVWSVVGVSKDHKQIKADKFKLEAGLLWQKITRENRSFGLKSEILSFVPASGEPVEIMQVTLTNISRRKLAISPTAAIPIYGRGADNLRDHRHVTSLLHRIILNKFGVIVKPTLSFNEAGHQPNKTLYFVLGWDEKSSAPQYIYPTHEIFCGDAGDLEAPESVLENSAPAKIPIQGKEAFGGLRFREITLAPGACRTYIIVMGITENEGEISAARKKFNTPAKVAKALAQTKEFWSDLGCRSGLKSGERDFDQWFSWVSIQPMLRRIFGCSFLPDFDYGRGGRGWRDLWQDCLGLILTNPKDSRALLVNNFAGVRIDGSNATIIGKKPGEFISDRNNISRVWMDHGVWPLITLNLYLNETGDYKILFENAPYFRNHEICRSRMRDAQWRPEYGQKLKTKNGAIYQGTILEHLLLQNLAQFLNVGAHNHVRLEGADWNDGMDMAAEKGESVTFSAMYAHNLKILSDLLLKAGQCKIRLAEELNILLRKINYTDIKQKQVLLAEYFYRTRSHVSGRKVDLDVEQLAADLHAKSKWMMEHIRQKEWLREGFFNGYYDNKGRRAEGRREGLLRMSLVSQVFPILSGAANTAQIQAALKSTRKYLWDKKTGGLRLNTDFKTEQYDLGRAFSFIYGDKENGAVFSHMVVMFANGLYKHGLVNDGWHFLRSLYDQAANTAKSKIYPCLPEYFNSEGRGMYSYLTGSASWYVLTLLTEAFGVKGKDGDLFIEPKLSAEQFRYAHAGAGSKSKFPVGAGFKPAPTLSICRVFAGRQLQINFSNPHKLPYGRYKIAKAALGKGCLVLSGAASLRIPRSLIIALPENRLNTLDILLD